MPPARSSVDSAESLSWRGPFVALMRVLTAQTRRGRPSLSRAEYEVVCEALDREELIVYPTDTLYGLGGDPYTDRALDLVYRAKQRPRDEPIPLALASPGDVWTYGHATHLARAFCVKHLPGPATVLLQATPKAPAGLLSTDGLVGIRVPDHPIAQAIAKAFGPITTTSANLHGGPSPATCAEAVRQLGESVAVYVEAGPTRHGKESTIVDLSGASAKVIREGVLRREDL